MAITAKFDADFSAFIAGTKDAEKDLQAFEKTSVQAMDAVADGIGDAGRAASELVPEVEGLTTSYSEFDRLLRLGGVNLGNQNKALEELGKMVGLSESALTKLGAAVGVVGAAMAGWNIGRSIAEWTGSDKIIGDATAKLLGWGDASEQVAGMQQDTINKAIRDGASATVTFSEALAFNTEKANENQVAAIAAGEAHAAWAEATAVLDTVGSSWQATLATMSGKTVEAVKFYLEAGVAQGTLRTAYSLTDQQIKAITESIKAETAAMKEAQKADEEAAKAIAAHWDGVGAILDEVFGVQALDKAQDWIDAIGAMGGSVEQLSNTQLVELRDAMLAGIDVLARTGQLTSEQSTLFAQMAAAASAAIPPLVEQTAAVDDLATALYNEARAIDETTRANQGAATATAAVAAARPDTLTFTPIVGGRPMTQAGPGHRPAGKPVSVFGGPGHAGSMGRGAPVSAFGGPVRAMYTPGYAPIHQNYVNVNGIMISDDPAAKEALAQAINMAMMGTLKRGGQHVGPGSR